MECDRLWRDVRLATMTDDALGLVDHGVVAARDGRIVYAGPAADAPSFEAEAITVCEGRWITPGLIDCHTHLIHAGNRAREFELRLKGASYEEIARAGGGIVSTMKATRAASEEALVESALPRLDALIAEGVTTVEVKSGYGLDTANELKMLRAARALGEARPVRISTTFLGAHALPPEYQDNADGYVDLIVDEMLPTVAREGLADMVDAYCETIGFNVTQTRRVLEAAKQAEIPIKLHAEQLSNMHGAKLAGDMGARSAEHLEYADAAAVAAMARAGTVATLLPGAYYFMREKQLPPIEALRAAGVPIALATDCNPGTSPLTSPLLALNMGATLFRLTTDECLLGVTRHAARALGLGAETGTLETGKSCDLAIWNIERPAELVYRIGYNPLHDRIWRGQ
jgi:imidazolonepropionase